MSVTFPRDERIQRFLRNSLKTRMAAGFIGEADSEAAVEHYEGVAKGIQDGSDMVHPPRKALPPVLESRLINDLHERP